MLCLHTLKKNKLQNINPAWFDGRVTRQNSCLLKYNRHHWSKIQNKDTGNHINKCCSSNIKNSKFKSAPTVSSNARNINKTMLCEVEIQLQP